MKFGLFYEHQIPRPWEDGDELRLFQEALVQVELANNSEFRKFPKMAINLPKLPKMDINFTKLK